MIAIDDRRSRMPFTHLSSETTSSTLLGSLHNFPNPQNKQTKNPYIGTICIGQMVICQITLCNIIYQPQNLVYYLATQLYMYIVNMHTEVTLHFCVY